MAGWGRFVNQAASFPTRNSVATRVWLLAVAAAVTGICIAAGVEPGSRTSYVVAGAGGAAALLLPWWLGRGDD